VINTSLWIFKFSLCVFLGALAGFIAWSMLAISLAVREANGWVVLFYFQAAFLPFGALAYKYFVRIIFNRMIPWRWLLYALLPLVLGLQHYFQFIFWLSVDDIRAENVGLLLLFAILFCLCVFLLVVARPIPRSEAVTLEGNKE